ncbi:MAG TPA: DMT family transporter [Burkholderiaceae bacterium]|nr:DMT family transporter [Burkholderiaceae bacterium]
MPAPPKTHGLSPAAAGLAWGLTAAAIWTVYSVLARLGIKSGLTPFDMTLLRFTPGALVMLPFVWRWGLRDMAGIGWRRGVVLAALSGPVFSLLMMTGFAHAPLAHGAVIAPACQMLAGIGFSAWLVRAAVTRETVFGATFVLLGLGFMGSDALLHGEGSSVALGDVLFAAAGASFGLFGALSRRWLVDPVRVTGVAVVLAFAMFAPLYAALADPRALLAAAPGFVALQAVAHGLGAGLVAVLAYSRAAMLLGPGRASFFGAMVPGAAALLAIPVLDEIPTALQVAGLLAVVAGLLLAFGAVRQLVNLPRGAGK